MSHLLQLAWASAWHRRFVLGITLAAVALSAALLVLIEQVRTDVRDGFSQSISGTDLIVGPRGGSTQLLLYSVFRLGQATNNMRWDSVQALASHRSVKWVVPLSLGDSHRGFPVVATTLAYFEHLRHGDDQALAMQAGRRFDESPAGLFEAVIGSEVARQLGIGVGARVVLSHGDGAFAENDHADKPFTVVGVLAATGTPVDRSIHIGLAAMQALHVDWLAGAPPMPGLSVPPQALQPTMLQPREVTAVLVGLRSRAAVFSVQRWLAEHDGEPLMGVLPGVALDELWQVVGVAERALLAVTALVALASFAGLAATMLAGLNERRRELAILRSVGASPRAILSLLAIEGATLCALGVALGWLLAWVALWAGQDLALTRWGVHLQPDWPTDGQWRLMAGVMIAGVIASLLPAWRAYQLSAQDGLRTP